MKIKVLCLFGGCVSIFASEASDKSQYTFWNPTPRELMREMSADRPDKTESPYTVDAGHFQIETDLASYTRDRESGTRVESWSFLNSNFKLGLCNSADIQFIVPTYNLLRTRNRAAGSLEKSSGFGDLVTRLKMNFWGNDGGQTAFGAMPFLKSPTAQDGLGNGAFEGGVIFPLAVELPHGWAMGAMTEFDFAEDANGSGYHPEFVNTITFGHAIIGNLSGYVEFFSLVSAERNSDWIGTFDMGLTYALNDNLQLDCGVNIGLTRSADDLNPFVGITWRF